MTDPRPPAPAPSTAPGGRAPAAAPAAGERLGVWRVGAVLFECASGLWVRVEHALAGGQQALALVYRHEADAQAVLMRFAEESDALGRFQHPAYGAALDSGLSPAGLPYLVVPFMEGAPLLRVAMALPVQRRLQVLLELIAIVDAARAHGLLLHELDPGTLWLSPSQQLHWLGQGLAPVQSEAPPLLVRAAEPLAHARQRSGARPDAGTQAFALGRLLGLLVNGRLPRGPGDAATPDDAEPIATPVASLQSWLSLTAAQREGLDQLLDRAMGEGRGFAEPALLAQAVRDWLDAVPAPPSARPAGGSPSAPMPLLPPPPPLPASSEALASPPAAFAAARWAAGALVLALALLAIWWVIQSR